MTLFPSQSVFDFKDIIKFKCAKKTDTVVLGAAIGKECAFPL